MGKDDGLVRYRHDLNSIEFGKLDSIDLNVFFALVYKLKLEGTKELVFSYSEVRKLAGYQNKSTERFDKFLKKLSNKLLSMTMYITSASEWTQFVLFPTFTSNKETSTVTIAVHNKFEYLLNQISGKNGEFYTSFNLQTYRELENKYSKVLFSLIRQWGGTNTFDITVSDFRRIFDVPPVYKMSHIKERIIDVSIKELSQHFQGLNVENVRNGREIVKFTFRWGAEILESDVPVEEPKGKNKIEVSHGEQMNMFQDKKIIKKAERELTSEEITKKKEEMMKLFKKEEKNSEQKNLDFVTGGTSPPVEEKYSQETLDKVHEYGYTAMSLKSAMDNFDIGVDEALEILRAEFYWKESQKKIEEYKKSKRQERIEKKQSTLERDFSHGEGSSRFIGYKTIEDLERFCFTENQINSIGLSLAIDLIELYGLHEEILSKTGKELNGTAKLFKMTKIIRKYGVIQP